MYKEQHHFTLAEFQVVLKPDEATLGCGRATPPLSVPDDRPMTYMAWVSQTRNRYSFGQYHKTTPAPVFVVSIMIMDFILPVTYSHTTRSREGSGTVVHSEGRGPGLRRRKSNSRGLTH